MPKGLGDVPPEQFRFPLDDIKRMQAMIKHQCYKRFISAIDKFFL